MTFHRKRIWVVTDEPTAAELASKLTNMTWTLCTGFRHRGYLFLNDASSENGAQEYAVVKEATGRQVESLTASWMTFGNMWQTIDAICAGAYDESDLGPVELAERVQSGEQHGRCHLCA